jgi:hypothetical protein
VLEPVGFISLPPFEGSVVELTLAAAVGVVLLVHWLAGTAGDVPEALVAEAPVAEIALGLVPAPADEAALEAALVEGAGDAASAFEGAAAPVAP